jgi:putative protease
VAAPEGPETGAAGTASGVTTGPAGPLPELLAPAGDRDALLAALSAGADAVYLGTEDLNARRNATNFSLGELAEACDLAHVAGRRIYLTLNTAVLQSEVGRAVEVAHRAWEAGIDALIVQDLGLLARLAHEMPQLALHASTQMNLHNIAGVRLAAELGASRVTLARELSMAEIRSIAQEGVPVEVFAHGALCVCYSGQCLFSSLVGRRSANRGLCAQACRLPYRLIDTSTGKGIRTPGEHLLSPADRATVDILPELLATGVTALKIEGRMKSALYVASATHAYREALDALIAPETSGVGAQTNGEASGRGGTQTNGEANGRGGAEAQAGRAGGRGSAQEGPPLDTLAESFSRGFTTAYLDGRRDNAMMSYTRPNNRGVAVGRIAEVGRGVAGIEVTKPLSRGDVLEFWTSRGRCTLMLEGLWATADGAGQDGSSLDDSGGHTRVYLRTAEAIHKGDRVFRVRSAALASRMGPDFDNTVFQGNNGIVALHAQVSARLGEAWELTFEVCQQKGTEGRGDAEGRDTGGRFFCATERGAKPIRLHKRTVPLCPVPLRPLAVAVTGPLVEAARTKPLSAEDIREQVGRVGGTPFSIRSWDIRLDEGVGMGFSSLHRLRSQALEALTEALLAPWRNRHLTPHEEPTALAPARKGRPRVAALVRDAAGARAAAQGGAELVYLHSLRFEITGEAGRKAAMGPHGTDGSPAASSPSLSIAGLGLPKGLPVRWFLPAVTHEKDTACIQRAVEEGTPAVANNLGGLQALRQAEAAWEAGPSLGICNGETLGLLARLGASQAWLSPELSQRDIAQVAPTAPLPLALTVFGQQEVMVTEHCVLMAQGPCDQRCETCVRRRAPRLLEDRKGYRLPIRTDDAGRSHLFNAVPLDLVPSMPELVSLGVSTLVVDGTLLAARDLRAAIERTVRARDLAVKGAGSLPKREGHTTGHFFRGVL